MTNTIPNVPRELKPVLAMILNALDRDAADGKQARAEMAAELRALISTQSPAGVDGLGNTAKLLLPALRQYMHNDGSGLLAGYDMETTQAIIDGVLGEVARLQRAEKNDAIAYKAALERQDELRDERDSFQRVGILAMEQRDQQARRVGELEGLLLRVQVSLSLDDTEWGYSGAEKYKLLADIRAALSAGKEGE